jgi:ubiquinone/menaquinone biosynthesis C-methylase UbiE
MTDDVVGTFDEAAGTYDRVGVDFFGPFGAELVRRAGPRPGERVLDVGCGRGAVLFPVARAVVPGGHVTATDGAPSMVDLTRAEAARLGLDHVSVEVGDAQSPAYPAGSFDLVTAGLVVFLLPDPHAALRAYARVLRPGGRLALSTFGPQDPHFTAAMRALARHLPPGGGPPPKPDDMFVSAEATTAALTAAGFGGVTHTDHSTVSRFRDEEHWLAWCWSHGARALLSRIPPDGLPAATADAFPEIRGARTDDGDLAITTAIRVHVATVAG